MDRPTIYYGQVPRAADLLALGQNAMIGLGALAQSALGTGTVIDGFTLTPTAPASLSAILGAGSVHQLEQIEPSPWSSFPVDTRPLVKQGVSLDAITLPFAPPTTPGYAQNFLVEVQYQDADAGALVLPYYNAANPQQPFAGPANSGTAQSTVRRGVAAVQVKAGVAATAGSQATPAPDAGWAGAYVVTLNAGQTQITAGSITRYAAAPFIRAKIPEIPSNVQASSWVYAPAGGTANALTASLIPPPVALVDGLTVWLAISTDNTGPATLNLNNLGAAPIASKGGDPLRAADLKAGDVVPLTMRGGSWRFRAIARSEVVTTIGAPALWHTGTAGGTASALTVTSVTPPIENEQDFIPCLIRVPQGVAKGATLTISGLAGPLQRNDGAPVQNGDAPFGGDILVTRHGGAWRLIGFGRVEVQRLVPNPVIWVRADGDDANDGSANDAAHAKRTLGAALNQGTSAFNFSTSSLVIRLGMPGTYLSPQYVPVAAGLIRIVGDEAARDNYVIYGEGSVAQGMLQGAGQTEIRGVKLQLNGGNAHVLVGTAGANILCLNTTLAVPQGTTGNHVLAAGGQVTLGAGCVITGNSASLAVGASGGEVIFNSNANIQIQGNPTFSVATVRADNLGRITLLGGAQVTGSAIGQRYLVGNYSIILVTGAGENAFPGSQAGFASSTGIYQ